MLACSSRMMGWSNPSTVARETCPAFDPLRTDKNKYRGPQSVLYFEECAEANSNRQQSMILRNTALEWG